MKGTFYNVVKIAEIKNYIRGHMMNIILGVVFLLGLLSFALTIFKDVGVQMIFNPDAFMIVIGGSVMALLVAFPFRRIKEAACDVIEAFGNDRQRDDLAKDILETARVYRKADIRNLEKRMSSMKDDFLRLGISLLISNRNRAEIRNIMEREMSIRIMHYNFSQNILKTLARLTPSFGLAGTVISLIKMFKNFESIEAIAPLMAVALMSTFYGVVISNLFMMPLCAKITDRAVISENLMNITIEGIEAIRNGEHPLSIEDKIMGHQKDETAGPSGVEKSFAVTKATS